MNRQEAIEYMEKNRGNRCRHARMEDGDYFLMQGIGAVVSPRGSALVGGDTDYYPCDDRGNPTPAMSQPEILYGVGDQERLDIDIDECIERYLDYDTHLTEGALEVKKYRRVTASLDHTWFLSDVLERLDENYSTAADEPTEPTQEMIAAAERFCASILAEYVPYNCTPTGNVITVDVAEWIKENAPEWAERKETE